MMSPLETDIIILLFAVPLLWAAVMDYMKRIIPDWTWIAILLLGVMSAFILPHPTLLQRIAGFLLPGICLLSLAMKYGGVGGGDIKLTAAIGFSFGLYGLTSIFFFALLPALLYSKVMRQKSVPLAVFLCTGFFVNLMLSILLIGRYISMETLLVILEQQF